MGLLVLHLDRLAGNTSLLGSIAARSNVLVACSLRSSAYLATASRNRPVISENGSTTKITDTLAPRDFASANPCATPCSASSDPSVGIRICRYMLHLPIVWTYRCLPNVSLPAFRIQS